RGAASGHAPQRIRPAGTGLHPRPAPLAALPPRRRLRLRPRLRRHPLRLQPRHRSRRAHRRQHARHLRPHLLSALGARTGRFVRRRPQSFPSPARGNRTCPRSGPGSEKSTTQTPLLDALNRTGTLRTLDHALAQSLRRLDPDTPDLVLAAAALASLAVANGHAGFDPAAPQELVDAPDIA